MAGELVWSTERERDNINYVQLIHQLLLKFRTSRANVELGGSLMFSNFKIDN